jgi:spermidine/putrescine transport system ATP-binding protein
MSSEAFLRIDGVERSFDGVKAVGSFALDIAEGEFVSLLGPSGCGKTTLLRLVAGLDYPDAGRIVLDGRDITDLPPNRRPLNLVFQRVTLFPHLNVFDNVSFGLRLRRTPARHMRELVSQHLELVGLAGFEKRDVTTLSGGESQRVALARALVNRPKVLLLDEPLGALDLQIRREIQIQLKDIHRRLGTTFLYVTHDQEEAMRMSDRIVVMSRGVIIQVGTPLEVYANPATTFVASFVGSSNVWEATVAEVGPGGVVLEAAGHRFEAPPWNGPKLGETAWLMLRPEALSLSRPESSVGGLRGRVVDVSFLGSVVHYRLAIGERELLASLPLEAAMALAEGDEVVVGWSAAAVRLLAK